MKENENTSDKIAQKAGQTGKNAVKFGVAAAKVFSGTATPNDWKTFLKYAIPVALGSMAVSLMGIVLIIGVLYGPVLTAVNYVKSAASSFISWITDFAEKRDNFIRGNGWYDDETAFQEALKKKYKYYSGKGVKIRTSYVMAVLNMKYVMIDQEVILGDDVDETTYDYMDEEDVEAGVTNANVMPFGQMIPDMKRLVEHMVHKKFSIPQLNFEVKYNLSLKAIKGLLSAGQGLLDLAPSNIQLSNENYLAYLRFGEWSNSSTHSSKMEYIKPTNEEILANVQKYKSGYIYKAFKKHFEGMDDNTVAYKIEYLIEDIYEYAETIADMTDEEDSANSICIGEYSEVGTANIDIKDLNNIYVNVAGESCGNSLESCSDWIAQEVPFKEYVMGVVFAENYTTNLEALKAQTIASKNYAIARSQKRTWQEVNGKYIIYMKGTEADQAYKDYNSLPDNVKNTLNSAYDSTMNYFLVDSSNQIVENSYCQDFGICSFCVKGEGTCLAQLSANNSPNQTFQEILGYYYSSYKLYDMSNNTLQVASVNCTPIAGSGQIRLPVDSNLYRVTSPYGERIHPIFGTRKFHTGIDIGVGTGTPIYAIAPGVVTLSKFNGGYGNTVILGHDTDFDGSYDYYTLYAHNSELLVSLGDNVAGGTIIAKAGSTGNSTGPHLHFEIRDKNNSHMDPAPFIEEIKQGTSVFNTMIVDKIKYYNQSDYSSVNYCTGNTSNGKQSTIASSGCLPTSVAMVVSALKDPSVTPTNVANNICSNYSNYRVNGSGTSNLVLTDKSFLGGYGLTSTHVTSDYENNIKSALSSGKVIIVNVRGGTFNPSGAGHYFVISELTGDQVKVYDPGSRARTKVFDISEVIENVNGGIWIFE